METSTSSQQQNNNQYYQAVIDAFKRVWKYKFLWIWGIFLPSGMSMNYGFDQNDLEDANTEVIIFQIQQFWIEHSVWIILGAVALFILIIAIWIFSAIARGGVINSINNLQEIKECDQDKVNQKEQLRNIWQIGKLRAWNIIKLDLLFILIELILLTVVIPPVFLAFKANNPFSAFLVIFLAIVIFIPIVFIIIFSKSIGLVYVALAKETPLKSIEHGYNLFIKNKREVIKLILTFLLLTIVFSVVAGIAIIIIGGILFIIFGLTYIITKSSVSIMISGIILSLIFLLFAFLLRSISALWRQDIWIWWIKKISSVKIEKAGIATVRDGLLNKNPKIIAEEKIN